MKTELPLNSYQYQLAHLEDTAAPWKQEKQGLESEGAQVFFLLFAEAGPG